MRRRASPAGIVGEDALVAESSPRMSAEEYRRLLNGAGVAPAAKRRKRSTWERVDGTPSENGEARELAKWLRQNKDPRGRPIRFAHIANEATSRHPAVATILRIMGLENGAPDYVIFSRPAPTTLQVAAGPGERGWPEWALSGAPRDVWHRRVQFCGVAIELKATTRPSTSRNQDKADAFLIDLQREGWYAARVNGAVRVVTILRALGFQGPPLVWHPRQVP